MSNESLLKKEFKQADVQRVRNLVNKDFTSKTKSQTGYKKSYKRRFANFWNLSWASIISSCSRW